MSAQIIGDPNEPIVINTPAQIDPPANETPEQKYQRLYAPKVATTDVNQTLQALQAEIASLKATISNPRTPTSETTAAASKLEWVKKIQEGDFDGAQQSMAQYVQQSIQPQLEAAKKEAYQSALSASQVNVEVDRYLNQVRSSNPDILPFERYLQGPVQERIALAQQAGRVNNPSDFLREYKAAVDSEVTNLRTLGLQFRAAGKDEALTRTSDVLRSTAMTPQQVQSTQSAQTDPAVNPPGESTDDYFARRRAAEDRVHGRA